MRGKCTRTRVPKKIHYAFHIVKLRNSVHDGLPVALGATSNRLQVVPEEGAGRQQEGVSASREVRLGRLNLANHFLRVLGLACGISVDKTESGRVPRAIP